MKKFIIVLLVVAVVASLCGCGEQYPGDLLEDCIAESMTITGKVVEKSLMPTFIKVATTEGEYVMCILSQIQLLKISAGDIVKISGRGYAPGDSSYSVKMRYCEILDSY